MNIQTENIFTDNFANIPAEVRLPAQCWDIEEQR